MKTFLERYAYIVLAGILQIRKCFQYVTETSTIMLLNTTVYGQFTMFNINPGITELFLRMIFSKPQLVRPNRSFLILELSGNVELYFILLMIFMFNVYF